MSDVPASPHPREGFKRCSSCGADVVFALYPKTGNIGPYDREPGYIDPDSGKRLPLDRGYEITVRHSDGRWVAEYVKDADGMLQRPELHTSHFATCPYAKQHRKER